MKLQEILGIKYPFIQGGMANIATGEFAARVSNAGGLGIIGSGGMTPEILEENIKIAKNITDKPFGINLMMMHPKVDEMAEIIKKSGVKVVTTGAGNPSKYIDGWKKNGIKIFPVVPNPTLAIKMEKLGVDGLIVEGLEAGGHIGQMTTMTLIPQVVAKTNIPVIAAGGIASGKQILASEVLGACGVQMGTIFLSANECPIHQNYKDKILASKDNHITTIGDVINMPIRVIRNNMTKEYREKERQGWDKMQLETFTLGALRRAVFDGDIKTGSLMAGLVVGQINEQKPVNIIMEELYNDYLNEKEKIKKC